MSFFFRFIILLTSITWAYVGANAHPLDVSNTSFAISGDSIAGVTYIHPAELDRILMQSGGVSPFDISVDQYYRMAGTLNQYLKETLQVENHGKLCQMGSFGVQEGLMIDEIFGGGFPISYTIVCDEPIQKPVIHITFCNEVPLQTNRLTIWITKNGTPTRADYRILNKNKTSHIFVADVGLSGTDADKDGITDEDEVLYGTDPHNVDTDSDGYTDATEIQSSWNPLSRELSPGQKAFSPEENTPKKENPTVPAASLAQDTQIWGGALFQSVLKHIRIFIETREQDSFFSLFLLVMELGALHALGPGHSKGILIGQILEKHITVTKIFSYAGVFSLVHILDIIVVVILSRYLLRVVDPSQYFPHIQFASILLIIIIGSYLLKKSLQKKGKTNIQKPSSHIFLAIISGLTPCAFGWSIFLMLIATQSTHLALPLLLALGLGIFLSLVGVGLVTLGIQRRIYSFTPKLALYSPIISASSIILIGCVLFFQYVSL